MKKILEDLIDTIVTFVASILLGLFYLPILILILSPLILPPILIICLIIKIIGG